MNRTNPKVDGFLGRAKRWKEEMESLRTIALECGLTEELKWGKPCYSFEGSNIAIIQPFRDTFALMFFKGVLMEDPAGVLEKPGENSRVAKRISFTGTADIIELDAVIRSYIGEAIKVEESGAEIELEDDPEPLAQELKDRLDNDPELRRAFEGLTPGRRRAYNLHFSSAKQSKTRAARVDRSIPQILEGKGLND